MRVKDADILRSWNLGFGVLELHVGCYELHVGPEVPPVCC